MRILFVAFANSIHTVRWVQQLAGLGWDVHVLSSDGRETHPAFRDVTVHSLLRKPPYFQASPPAGLGEWLRLGHHPSVRQRGVWFPFSIGGGLEVRLEKRLPLRARLLARTLRRLRPDVVHALELNHAGKLVLEAKRLLGGRLPPWITSTWGNDIYLFGRLPEEAAVIREVLAECPYLISESRRDEDLARAFGFAGAFLPRSPVCGGYDLDAFARLRGGPPSGRRVIALKGYQSWAGRALVALQALRRCRDLLDGYTLALYSASPDVLLAARLLCEETGLRLEVLGPRSPHEQVVAVHGRARVSIGLSISDGIPAAVLEAMILGAFPVQSSTSTADEWLTDGETGLLVPPEEPEAVEQALRRALTDDALVDRAAALNAEVARARLDERQLRPRVIEMYEQLAARAGSPA